MAPHLSHTDLNVVVECLGKRQTLKEIHEVIKLKREPAGLVPPKTWAIRRACRGTTHRRGRPGLVFNCSMFHYMFYHTHMAPAVAATKVYIAIYRQNAGSRWKPLETVGNRCGNC